MPPECTGFFCLNLTNVFQIAFWVIGGVVAILSYRQAKRSLFQPVRVEVFKLQLAVLTKIYEKYALKGETDLMRQFDLPRCVDYNAEIMLERYALSAFQAVPKESARDRAREEFPGAMVTAKPDELIQLASPPDPDSDNEDDNDNDNAEMPDWESRAIHFSNKYAKAVDEVEAFKRDPLVPAGLVAILDDLADAVGENLAAIRPTLDDAADVLPRSYPTVESLEGVRLAWVSNIWNRRRPSLEPVASRVGEFIREYLRSEEVGRTEKRPEREASSSRRWSIRRANERTPAS